MAAGHPDADGRLGELFKYAGRRGIPLFYGLIDEYDNFANTVLAHHGRERHIGVAVVFHGWEMAACEAVDDEDAERPGESADGR